MHRPLPLLILVVVLLAGCSADDSANEVTTTTVSAATTLSPTTLASGATTTSNAAATSVTSTTQMTLSEVSDCPSPSPTTDDDSDEYVRLHLAVEQLLVSTNQLGTTLLDLDDFNEGWENSEQVTPIVETIHVDLATLETEAAAILTDTFGATFDQEGMWWQFPEALWPVSPELASLEQVSLGVYEYRDTILPLLFTFSDRSEAIQHWNYGASPCGHAYTLGLLLENARPALNP